MTKEEEKYITLDLEQCKWWVNHLFNMAKEQACNSHNLDDAEEMQAAQDKIIKALEQQPSEDCVSRQEIIDLIETCNSDGLKGIFCSYNDGERFKEYVKDLPPVTPTHCIAAFRFSKEDLREICKERIEVACEHGTCEHCNNWDEEKRVDGACFCNVWRNYTGYEFYCGDFQRRIR